MMGYGWFGPGAWLLMIGWMLLLGALVVGIVWLIGRGASAASANRGSSQSPRSSEDAAAPTTPPTSDAALDALRMRFARGEISREEYLAAKETLEESR